MKNIGLIGNQSSVGLLESLKDMKFFAFGSEERLVIYTDVPCLKLWNEKKNEFEGLEMLPFQYQHSFSMSIRKFNPALKYGDVLKALEEAPVGSIVNSSDMVGYQRIGDHRWTKDSCGIWIYDYVENTKDTRLYFAAAA